MDARTYVHTCNLHTSSLRVIAAAAAAATAAGPAVSAEFEHRMRMDFSGRDLGLVGPG